VAPGKEQTNESEDQGTEERLLGVHDKHSLWVTAVFVAQPC